MDIIEFAEKICGIELLPYQKELLKKFESLPKGERFICFPPRCGKRLTLDIIERFEKEKQNDHIES